MVHRPHGGVTAPGPSQRASLQVRATRAAPQAAMLLAVFLLPLAAMMVFTGDIAGGDSGQWVMLARAYGGAEVPAYRDPTAVPPAAPLLVLASWGLTGDPYAAVRLALAVAVGLVALSAFVLGRELFGPLAGAAGAVLVVGGQSLFLRLASYGALPQLLALAGVGFSLAAIAWRMRTPSRASAVGLAVAALFILLAHVPTAVTALPVLAAVLLLAPPGPARAHPRAVAPWLLRRVAPLLPAAAGLGAYVLVKRDTFEQYLTNEATFSLRGLGPAISELLRLRASSAMFIVGAGLVLFVAARAVVALRDAGWDPARAARGEGDEVRPALVLALPVVLIGAFALTFHLLRIGTDYPRIFPLAGLPAVVAVGALLPRQPWSGLAGAPAPLPPGRPRRHRLLAFGLVALLLAGTVPLVVAQEQRAMRYYSVASGADLRDSLAEVERRVPPGDTVWTPIREGKWLEGVTGRAALFALPAWAIFRPWEWERKAAGETVASGTALLATGALTMRFQANATVSADDPLFLVYYKGEHHPVLRLDDAASFVVLASGETVPLDRLSVRSEELRPEGAGWVYEQVAKAPDPVTGDVEVVRRATLTEGLWSAGLSFEARATEPVAALVLAFAPPAIQAWERQVGDGQATALVTRFAQPFGLSLVHRGGSPAVFEAHPERRVALVVTPSPGALTATAELEVVPRSVGAPPHELATLTAVQALDKYGVRWALLPAERMATERASALSLGFVPVHQNGSYILLQRGGGP